MVQPFSIHSCIALEVSLVRFVMLQEGPMLRFLCAFTRLIPECFSSKCRLSVSRRLHLFP